MNNKKKYYKNKIKILWKLFMIYQIVFIDKKQDIRWYWLFRHDQVLYTISYFYLWKLFMIDQIVFIDKK